jgi:hypothetical protein
MVLEVKVAEIKKHTQLRLDYGVKGKVVVSIF